MKVILFIHIFGTGWIHFNDYDSFYRCETVKNYIINSDVSRFEGFCCLLTKSSCINLLSEERLNEKRSGSFESTD